MSDNIFENASRAKLRFASARGELTVEQLWDVPLRSRDDFSLDAVAKVASSTLKKATEESFVDTAKSPSQERLELAMAVVLHVIGVKLDEEKAAKRRAENKVEKERLLAILAEKQDGKLSALSEAELKKRIAALGD